MTDENVEFLLRFMLFVMVSVAVLLTLAVLIWQCRWRCLHKTITNASSELVELVIDKVRDEYHCVTWWLDGPIADEWEKSFIFSDTYDLDVIFRKYEDLSQRKVPENIRQETRNLMPGSALEVVHKNMRRCRCYVVGVEETKDNNARIIYTTGMRLLQKTDWLDPWIGQWHHSMLYYAAVCGDAWLSDMGLGNEILDTDMWSVARGVSYDLLDDKGKWISFVTGEDCLFVPLIRLHIDAQTLSSAKKVALYLHDPAVNKGKCECGNQCKAPRVELNGMLCRRKHKPPLGSVENAHRIS